MKNRFLSFLDKFFYYSLIKEFYKNFLTEQKKRLVGYWILSLVCLALECIGIGLLLPVLQYLLQPGKELTFLPHWFCSFPPTQTVIVFAIASILSITVKDLLSIYANSILLQIEKTFVFSANKKLFSLEKNLTYTAFLKIKHAKLQTIHQSFIRNCYLFLTSYTAYLANSLILLSMLFILVWVTPLFTTGLFVWLCIILSIYKRCKRIQLSSGNIYQQEAQALLTHVISYKESVISNKNILPRQTFTQRMSQAISQEAYIMFLGNSSPFFLELFTVVGLGMLVAFFSIRIPIHVLLLQISFLLIGLTRMLPFGNRIFSNKAILSQVNEGVLAVNQFYNFLQYRQLPPYHGELVTFRHQIQLEHVYFSYEPSKEILKNISLTIQEHDFIGLVGKSGQGKTTLVDLILGLLPLDKGTYSIDGCSITSHNQLAPFFGYVSQSPCIVTGTLAENIAFESNFNRKRVEKVMELTQLEEFQPDTYLEEMGKNISGGQKQRIAIARALYSQPKVLILDEPTASLDAITEEKISNIISSLQKTCTIIAIAHRLGTLKQCNRLFLMEAGRIKAEGSFQSLYQSSDDFKELVDAMERQAHLIHPIENHEKVAVR